MTDTPEGVMMEDANFLRAEKEFFKKVNLVARCIGTDNLNGKQTEILKLSRTTKQFNCQIVPA